MENQKVRPSHPTGCKPVKINPMYSAVHAIGKLESTRYFQHINLIKEGPIYCSGALYSVYMTKLDPRGLI